MTNTPKTSPNKVKKSNLSDEPMVPRELFERALSIAYKHICPHEETHRAGAIWEICDSCGMKWADDEGGIAAYENKELLELEAIEKEANNE
jgi:hypothetical protein